MTGNEYLRALRRRQLVTLNHDLRNGEGALLAAAGQPFLVRLAIDEWGTFRLVAYGTAPDADNWRVELAPGDLHDAVARTAA
jgi:hypothetical protein